ncbi:MAG: peroxide stress protein YaaA [Chloroflexi bacterium]|nr:peroxide stress protein YaaA [Chloroflexota bacterium]
MAGEPLILLPPSEGKASGGDGSPLDFGSLSFGPLNPTRVRMAKALVQLSQRPRSSKKLLGVKGAALEKAMADNARLQIAPTLPAIERYTGVMYDAIHYRSLDGDAREAFGSTVIIMSGLFGMVRPFDMIPAYKLKMGARLLRNKTCAAVWKPLISKSLANVAQNGVIWDLLPNEHAAAWDPSTVPYKTRFTVKFVERAASGQLKTVTHLSKLLKGALVRHLVSNSAEAGTAESALQLAAGFSHPEGYKFDPDLTTEVDRTTELIFLKDQSN